VNLTVARRDGQRVRGLTFGEARSALVCRVGRFVAIRDRRVIDEGERETERGTKGSVVLPPFVSECTRRRRGTGRTHARTHVRTHASVRERASDSREETIVERASPSLRDHRPCECGRCAIERGSGAEEGNFQGLRPQQVTHFSGCEDIFSLSALRPPPRPRSGRCGYRERRVTSIRSGLVLSPGSLLLVAISLYLPFLRSRAYSRSDL